MNPRILEIAAEAGIDTEAWRTYPGGFPREDYLVMKKFAELIVQECASLKLDPMQIDEAQYYHGWLDYRDLILEHFKD